MRAIMTAMMLRKFRVTVYVDGRKKTRHIRARDRSHALEQANVIAAVGRTPPGKILSVVQMGIA